MLYTLREFVQERAGSLVSKKAGAALAGGSIAMAAEGAAQDSVVLITIAYIISQAVVDAAKAWRGE